MEKFRNTLAESAQCLIGVKQIGQRYPKMRFCACLVSLFFILKHPDGSALTVHYMRTGRILVNVQETDVHGGAAYNEYFI